MKTQRILKMQRLPEDTQEGLMFIVGILALASDRMKTSILAKFVSSYNTNASILISNNLKTKQQQNRRNAGKAASLSFHSVTFYYMNLLQHLRKSKDMEFGIHCGRKCGDHHLTEKVLS
jgi:hypothetical protein